VELRRFSSLFLFKKYQDMDWWKEYNIPKLLDVYEMQNWFLNPLNIEYLVSVKGNRVEFNKNSIAVEDD
jgi:hypothetical protein